MNSVSLDSDLSNGQQYSFDKQQLGPVSQRMVRTSKDR